MVDLAIFSSHPIQYKAPLYRRLARTEDIDLMVFYGSKRGVSPSDIGFNQKQKWDLPLLEGYEHKFLSNYSWSDSVAGFTSLINPSLATAISGSFDALLIHTGYYRISSILAMLGAKARGVRVLLHGTGHKHEVPPHVEIAKQSYVRPFLKGVDWVMADCSANKEYYQSFGFPADRITIMPAAVDNERFQNARSNLDDDTVASLRSELGIPSSHRVLLYVGKLIQRKRVGDLLSAFDGVPDGIGATLLIVGDGGSREQLENQCADQEIEDVVFAGYRGQSELPAFYELGDVFVLPSSYDPSPKVLNEAMNFELPLVTSDGVGTAGELIDGNGDIFPVGDVQALAGILEEYLSDTTNIETMGERSREIVDEWSYGADVAAFKEALSELDVE